MKLQNEKIFVNIIIFQIILLFFMPTVGNMSSSVGIVTYSLFGIISTFFIVFFLIKEEISVDKSIIAVLGFYIICMVTGVWGMIHYKNPFSDVIRGIIPFAWYLYIPCLSRFSVEAFEKLKGVIKYLTFFYAVRIFVYYTVYVIIGNGSRVTLYLDSATAMMPMVGLIICIYDLMSQTSYSKWNSIVNYLIIIITYISITITATKSMVLSVICGVIVISVLMFSTNKKKKKIVTNVIAISVIFIIVTGGIFAIDSNIGSRWESGSKALSNIHEQIDEEIPSDGSIAPRVEEYKVAIDNFKESPLFGKGIGYRWESTNVDYGEPVIFVHNVIMFVLMDMGLLGISYILLIVGIIIGTYIKGYRSIKINNKQLTNLALSILIMAFIYANMFAVFRTIEFTILCAIFISMLIRMSNITLHNVRKDNKTYE